jgi:RNA polymerase sigma-70 factor, ECF subfamily
MDRSAIVQSLEETINSALDRFGSFDRDGFASFVVSKSEDKSASERETYHQKLRLPDLALVFAAGTGSPRAAAEVEKLLREGCPRWVRSTGADASDVAQQVLTYLLVAPPGDALRILEYRGVAPLVSFLRIVCTRSAISIARKTLAESNLSLSYEIASPGDDPEIGAFRERFREPFAEAMRASLSEMEPRQKTLLKLHFAKGLQVAQLAVMYNVHRVSMSRWIAEAKDAVFESVRAKFREQMRVPMSDSEFQSIVRLLKSEMDLKLSTLREDEVP